MIEDIFVLDWELVVAKLLYSAVLGFVFKVFILDIGINWSVLILYVCPT